MTGRDDLGRFAPGNGFASSGGRARAAALTPERRRQIARAGWLALVDKRFDGNASEAARYIGKVGAWATDAPSRDGFPKFAHPGPMPGGDDLTSEKGDMAWQQ